jgi:H+/Cl- antiporter ClcA
MARPEGAAPAATRVRSVPRLQALGNGLVLALLGALVGLVCWPLNALDRLQDRLIGGLPAFGGGGWGSSSLVLALAPVAVVPLLLQLQAHRLRAAAGSGLPQLVEALESPNLRGRLLAPATTVGRLGLWAVATAALLPIGREGPATQLGAAVAWSVGKLVRPAGLPPSLIAAAAGAALAGAFNTPLVGVLFVVEELTRRADARLLWSTLLLCGVAAQVAGLGGQPLFALGQVAPPVPELRQALYALPIGLTAGLLAASMARLVVAASRWLQPLAQERPGATGLVLGNGLALLALLSGGRSCGDGEVLLRQWIDHPPDLSTQSWLVEVGLRLMGPVLALAGGIPGGLIDPAYALGGSVGGGLALRLGGETSMGVLLGMAAGLAGATQLPLVSLAFTVRIGGAQSMLPGLLVAALCGAAMGRLVMPTPIYRALAAAALREPRGE